MINKDVVTSEYNGRQYTFYSMAHRDEPNNFVFYNAEVEDLVGAVREYLLEVHNASLDGE